MAISISGPNLAKRCASGNVVAASFSSVRNRRFRISRQRLPDWVPDRLEEAIWSQCNGNKQKICKSQIGTKSWFGDWKWLAGWNPDNCEIKEMESANWWADAIVIDACIGIVIEVSIAITKKNIAIIISAGRDNTWMPKRISPWNPGIKNRCHWI